MQRVWRLAEVAQGHSRRFLVRSMNLLLLWEPLTYDQISGHLGWIMVTANVAQAKAHLSELLDKVEAGEHVIITRHGRAVARLHSVAPEASAHA